MKIPRAIWLIIGFVLLVHIPFLRSAAVFDEPGYLEGIYRTYTNHLNPFISWEGYKPPVTVWVPALLSVFSGPGREVARLWIILLSGASVFVFYLLAERLFGRKTALLAAAVFSVFPLFLIQGYIVSDAIPLAFGMLCLWYFLVTGNITGFMVSGVWVLLTKETALLAYALSAFLFIFFANPRQRWLRIISVLVPLFPFAVWLLLNKQLLGWYVWPGSAAKIHTMIFPTEAAVSVFLINAYRVLFNPYTTLLTLLSLYRLRLGKFPSSTDRRLINIWVAMFFVYVYLYSNIGLEIRYILFLYPVLILLASDAVIKILENRRRVGQILFLLIFLVSIGWHAYATIAENSTYPEESINVFAYRNMAQQMVSYVNQQYPHVSLVTSWPNIAVWQNDPLVNGRKAHTVFFCPTKTTDVHSFWKRYSPGSDYLYIKSSRVHLFDCDFRSLRLVLITELHSTLFPWFTDSIQIFRILPPE